jgi:hypothetical protein
MIEAQNAVPVRPNVIIEGIRDGHQDGETLLRKTFGRGLRFLARRSCEHNAEECFNAAMSATVRAIQKGAVSSDEEIPTLILKELKRMVFRFSRRGPGQRAAIPELLVCDPDKVADVQLRLNVFGPLHREVLVRFYVKGEHIPTICVDLNMEPEQVDFLRAAARMAVRAGLQFSKVPFKKTAEIAVLTLASGSAMAG